MNTVSTYMWGYVIFRPRQHKVKQYKHQKEPDACTDMEGCIRLAAKRDAKGLFIQKLLTRILLSG